MKPNILVIHADQLRQDCLEPYGNKQVHTRNIAALAEDGAVFDAHFCPYPICTPSRYSLLSGQYAHQHLGWGNHCTLPQGIDTFPRVLKENGWHTAAVGKMHFTPTYLDVGFERMTLAEQDGMGRFDDDYHRYLMEHGMLDDIDLIDQRSEYREHAFDKYYESFGVQVSNLPEEYHSTSWITRCARQEIERWDIDGGNLLMIGYIKPHHPFDPPKRYADMYCAHDMQILGGYTDAVPERDYVFNRGYFDNMKLTAERLKKMIAYYYAAITHIDDGVGEILCQLKENGFYENTMIIFTSDHGDFLGFHHMALKQNHMYDPLMKIPLIIKYPGGEHSGERIQGMSSNNDIAAEILRTCGINVPPMMNSNPLIDCRGREYVFGEQLCMDGNQRKYYYMIRSKQYKLLVNASLDNVMFFDLEKDQFELDDRSKDPALALELVRHRDYLLQCLAFDGQSGVHLNEDARVNNPENTTNEMKRETMRVYFEHKSAVGYKVAKGGK